MRENPKRRNGKITDGLYGLAEYLLLFVIMDYDITCDDL